MGGVQAMEFLRSALPIAATVAMGFLLVVLLVRYFVLPFRSDVLPILAGALPAKRRAAKPVALKRVLIAVAAAFLVSRALIFVTALVVTGGDVLSDPMNALARWDASHYLGLAENWYVNEGDARFHLVFYPLYPLIVRGLYLLGMNAALAGTIVSNACLLLSGIALYRLVELEQSPEAGERAARLFFFTPLSFFFSIPYSESLFFLLTGSSVVMARRRKFPLALLLGALAASARLLGLLVAVPIFYEYLLVLRERRGGVRMALTSFAKCLVVALGFVAYLYLNHSVSGDPFKFLTYQREHWSQQMGSLGGTLRYTIGNAFFYSNEALRLGTWIPQSLTILLLIALLIATYRKVSPGDGAYALLYIYFAVAPTWLLSGTRYLTAMYALYPMLASATEQRRAADIGVMAVSVGATCLMVYLFFAGGVL